MKKKVAELLIRYIITVLIVLFSFFVPFFSIIFRPLTVWPVVFILGGFYEIVIESLERIIVQGHGIAFVEACIAGSAYLLLLILNLLTREIGIFKRIIVFIFGAVLLLAMNILRLVMFVPLLVNGAIFFDTLHTAVWYGASTVFVVFIWVISVFVFKIKKIPFVSDVWFILRLGKRKSKKNS